MKTTFGLVFLLLINKHIIAQTLLFGVTADGGQNNMGVLFSFNATTNVYNKLVDFDGTNTGSYPLSSLIETTTGELYGTTVGGGLNDLGTIFKYNPITNTITKKNDFDGLNGSTIRGSVIQASDGKLYGTTELGGVNDFGVLYQYDPITDVYTKKVDFNGISMGANPWGSLIEFTDGKLYGLTAFGGTKNDGVLFQYDPSNNTITKKLDFDSLISGKAPESTKLMMSSDGKLYGMTCFGGSNGKGVLFQYDPITNVYLKKIDFDGVNKGSYPLGSLMQASDGNLYGITWYGGLNDKGVIFQYNPSNNILTKKIDFNGAGNGRNSRSSFFQASDGKLYSTTFFGGANDFGVLFQYDFISNVLTKKIDFNGTLNGGYPSYASLIELNQLPNSVKENINKHDLNIYPNPVSEYFSVASQESISNLQIFNSSGELIYNSSCIDETFSLYIGNFKQGIYDIKIVFKNGTSVTKKISIVH